MIDNSGESQPDVEALSGRKLSITMDDPNAGTPASLKKLLALARKQSLQLQALPTSTDKRSTIGRKSLGRRSLLDLVQVDSPSGSQPAKEHAESGRKSGLRISANVQARRPFAVQAAQEPAESGRKSRGRKSANDNVQAHRPSEIQPAQEPAESSNRWRSGPPLSILKSTEAGLESSSDQLKEMRTRAMASGLNASLRKDLSYEAYAKINFRTELGCSKSRDIEDLITFTEKRISEPLLQSVHQRDKHDAVAVFTHLMAYMGDLGRIKSATGHLLQVLSGGLRKPDLRDEIYCQICKQTTDNPDSVSNARGWQAMALSCGLFPPSKRFLLVLEAHLEQVINGTVRTTKDKGKRSEEAVTPLDLATYSLFRLRKLVSVGARHLLPLPEEISAVEKMGNISATIFLPDSTSKSMPLDPMITTEEVVIKIVQILGLSEPKYFCLWEVDPDQVEKSLGRKEYVVEVQSRWASSCIPQSVSDFQSPWRRCMTCWRQAHKKIATVNDLGDTVLDQLFVMKSKGEHKPRLLFKRNLFLTSQDVTVALTIRNRELALDYSQAVHDVLRGAYPLAKDDLVMLAALQLRAELGSDISRDVQMGKYLPERLEGNDDKLKGMIISIANGLPEDPSPAVRRIDYLDYLKTRYVLAEASWYSAKQTDNEALPEAFLVAINASGVYFLLPDTMEEILHMKYEEICSWAYSNTCFSIVTGNVTHNQDHRLITLQGSDMSQAMGLFVNRLF